MISSWLSYNDSKQEYRKLPLIIPGLINLRRGFWERLEPRRLISDRLITEGLITERAYNRGDL